MKHKDFNPTMPFLDFIEQYDRVERIYYDEEETNEKEASKLKKIYQMSQTTDINSIPESMPFQPSYRFMTVACQIGNTEEEIFDILKRNSQLPEDMESKSWNEIDDKDLNRFLTRINHVRNWLELYAPNFVKFEVQKEIPKVQLTNPQSEFLLKVADLLEKADFTPEELHEEMYTILNEQDMKPNKAFQAIYKTIIGKKQGPRAASFILSLDKDFVINRFRMKA
jgi:lysyl-tRNA synthetase class 1